MYSHKHPDGGYGWVIVFASALSNFFTLSILQCFGLILKDIFAEVGLSATQGALIITLNASFGLITGPITGVFQKMYGCRKVALVSALLMTLGMIWTAFAGSFTSLVLTFGIITSLGMQISESTHRLAINLYFKEKRSLATGFLMTASGFGPILVPQLIRFLLKMYTTHEVTLLLGGICAHVFISAMLLQPVEWHLKEEGNSEETVEMNEKIEEKKEIETNICGKISENVIKTFDLDLLKDPVFDNMLIGLALATFAELNFTILIPFILDDFQFTNDQIAIFLSTLGVADMVSRFIGPYVGNYFTKPARLMFAYSLVVLIVIKFTVIISNNFYALLAIGFTMGIAKGIRKVYMWLVIPEYVPLKKLASAAGLDMMARGVCILSGGPILGALRDATGSYVICIIVMNCVTITTILLWTIEATILKYTRKKLCRESTLLR